LKGETTMASITSKLLGVNKLGISMTITMKGDLGEHCLTIRSTQEMRHAWNYSLATPDGTCFRLKCDEFLHDNDRELFSHENIFHVSDMMHKVMTLGYREGTNAA
jgi:hypothetical protein